MAYQPSRAQIERDEQWFADGAAAQEALARAPKPKAAPADDEPYRIFSEHDRDEAKL